MSFFDSIAAKIGTLLFFVSTLERIVPHEFFDTISRFVRKTVDIFNPYIEITFEEFPPETYGRSKAYVAIQGYLGANFSVRAGRLKAHVAAGGRSVDLSMDDYEEITEVYRDVKVSWMRSTSYPRSNVISFKDSIDEKRAYVLSFRRKDRDVVVGSYLSHVFVEGKAIRAIVVIEDIDCSLKNFGNRKGKNGHDNDEDDPTEDTIRKAASGSDDKEESEVTLSGLLNFMDGLWSASGGERIFIFTTNHVDKIDQAMIRRGRMDKHIEMSYCCFEAFKVLAKNYLNIDSHEKFEKIRCLLEEREISTADVAENLMPKSAEVGADECLENLVTVLERKGKEEEEDDDGEGKKMKEEREDGESVERRRNEVFRRLKTSIRRLLSQKQESFS